MMMLAKTPTLYYNAKELADLLDVDYRTLLRNVRKLGMYGLIWVIKVRGRVYVSLYLHCELVEAGAIVLFGPRSRECGWALRREELEGDGTTLNK